jgi:hypothetical protein
MIIKRVLSGLAAAWVLELLAIALAWLAWRYLRDR